MSLVYVIHHGGAFWRRRHGHARSAWVPHLSKASLYNRLSDAKRACARIGTEGRVEIWQVEMAKRLTAYEIVNHSAQKTPCPSVHIEL